MAGPFEFVQIGVIHSCYKEKFAIPRQPGLVAAQTATLELLPPYNRAEAVKGLEGFSHIWVSFIFHAVAPGKWSALVRPPRLGGNERVGVFASRSTHRPNPLGLSVVELAAIESSADGVLLHLIGADLLDGTPVVDIKPYIPYVDSIPDARAGFAPAAPVARMQVEFAAAAQERLERERERLPQLQQVISESLAYDPRPAYKAGAAGSGGVRLFDFDVRYAITGTRLMVTAIVPLADEWDKMNRLLARE
ncbi:MAG: tRNA (N6-threonylcarbamoyladenosine(37)-N6)-methyltransferase TrmO [Gammaproteobacteria bacterium]|nr:tRNA (N6-threonylcarbamoyladenosine(37)-N6)-methyltransferase TrmO [Gammaproteobacteria bacterium]